MSAITEGSSATDWYLPNVILPAWILFRTSPKQDRARSWPSVIEEIMSVGEETYVTRADVLLVCNVIIDDLQETLALFRN